MKKELGLVLLCLLVQVALVYHHLKGVVPAEVEKPFVADFEIQVQEPEPEPQGLPDYTADCKSPPPKNLTKIIIEESRTFGLDPRILAVTVHRESGCDPKALGSSGEIGLTQILPAWSAKLQKAGLIKKTRDLWDPRTNLRASAWIFSRLSVAAEGSLWGMFRRYNGSGKKAEAYATDQKRALRRLRLPEDS